MWCGNVPTLQINILPRQNRSNYIHTLPMDEILRYLGDALMCLEKYLCTSPLHVNSNKAMLMGQIEADIT